MQRMPEQPVFILGSFAHPHNKRHHTTAAEQLAALFNKYQLPVLTATRQYRKLPKLVHTAWSILRHSHRFRIAILPLYGTPMSYWWQEIAAGILKLLRKKIILVVHGGSIPAQLHNGATKFHRSLRRADVVVFPSGYMQHALAPYGFAGTVIENVIDTAAYPFTHKTIFRPSVLWMRSFSDTYDPMLAVETAALLYHKFPGFSMAMAGGDLGMLQQVKDRVEALGLQDCIRFPGYLDHAAKLKAAQDYDIYLCTNKIDNAPVTIVECMALGLAIVSVDTGGIPFMVTNEVNGLLAPYGNATALAAAIERIITTPGLGERICAAAQLSSQQYAEAPVLEKWKIMLGHLEGEV